MPGHPCRQHPQCLHRWRTCNSWCNRCACPPRSATRRPTTSAHAHRTVQPQRPVPGPLRAPKSGRRLPSCAAPAAPLSQRALTRVLFTQPFATRPPQFASFQHSCVVATLLTMCPMRVVLLGVSVLIAAVVLFLSENTSPANLTAKQQQQQGNGKVRQGWGIQEHVSLSAKLDSRGAVEE